MTVVEARALADRLVTVARDGGADDRRRAFAELADLDGRAWLLLDTAARQHHWSTGTPVSGAAVGLGPDLDEPTGVVAVVTSLHVDGRVRERALRVLETSPPALGVPALAVRLLDHVDQVRTQAWTSLRPLLDTSTAAPVLDVLLAGRGRQHGPRALAVVTERLSAVVTDAVLVTTLLADGPRDVRRWAHEMARARGVLSTDQLVTAALHDPDQWVQARCAAWLMDEPDPSHLAPLLGATSVEARLVALTRAHDDDLDTDALERLLLDRAPRVREQARWRARRRGLDPLDVYRAHLAAPGAPPRAVAACLDGLAQVGDAADADAVAEALAHGSPRVRAAAVAAVVARAETDEAVRLLVPLLLDPAARVVTAAARALATLDAPAQLAEAAWSSQRTTQRRGAWRVARATGGWERVRADLRAAADRDPELAALGRDGISNWLVVHAATTWGTPTPSQAHDIEDLLTTPGLSEHQRRQVAFSAGVAAPPSARPPTGDDAPEQAPGPPGPAPTLLGRVRRLLRPR